MAPLQGLSGLYPDPQDTTDYMDEGVLESQANTLHKDHGEYGQQDIGYSGTDPLFVPYGPMSVYDGWESTDAAQYGGRDYMMPGDALDHTPVTHVSPYPKGIIQQSWDNPNALAVYGEQLNQLHGPELGGTRLFLAHAPSGHEEDTDYTTDRYDAPNENHLNPEVPGQLRSGSPFGSAGKDTTQGFGELNSLPEFQMGHSIRRVQHDRMPWDFTNTHGEQMVPFQGRHPVQQMPFDGPDSPYYAMGSIDGNQIPWEGRIGYPTPYQQPEEPTMVPAGPSQDVWAWLCLKTLSSQVWDRSIRSMLSLVWLSALVLP